MTEQSAALSERYDKLEKRYIVRCSMKCAKQGKNPRVGVIKRGAIIIGKSFFSMLFGKHL
jgi:hypothetical protein